MDVQQKMAVARSFMELSLVKKAMESICLLVRLQSEFDLSSEMHLLYADLFLHQGKEYHCGSKMMMEQKPRSGYGISLLLS